MEVTLDKKVGFECLHQLMHLLENGLYPFNQPGVGNLPVDDLISPQLIPGGIEEGLYWTVVNNWMRGGVKSITALRGVARICEREPGWFDPHFARWLDPASMVGVIKEAGLGFQLTAARQWVENSHRLVENWNGDARNIYRGIETIAKRQGHYAAFEELCRRMCNERKQGKWHGLMGHQHKMVPMHAWWMMKRLLVAYLPLPGPVDFQLGRFFCQLRGILRFNYGNVEPSEFNHYQKVVTDKIRELLLDFVLETGISWLDLSDALWWFPQVMCRYHPGNMTSVPRLGERNGRQTKLTPVELLWTPSQDRAYTRSCEACIFEDRCSHRSPAAEHYVKGRMVLLNRGKKPQATLLTPEQIIRTMAPKTEEDKR